MKTRIPFFHHDLGEAELEAIRQVFAGPILTTGATVLEFERAFASYLGCRHAIGVTSCTGGLHLALLALGVKPGDEVITTPMSFVATATAILQAGAVPVFIDVEPDTGNLDATRIESAITSKTRAIIPVHLYGLMCDMLKIREIADCHGIGVVEDAAHCIEGVRDGYRPGQLGDMACFSFYATKNITSGEGGAIVTNSEELDAKLRLLRHHGVTKGAADRERNGYSHWDMEVMGWKYNMDNIQAALLLPQMKRIETNLALRNRHALLYQESFAGIEKIHWPTSRNGAVHAHHLSTAWVPGYHRDQVINELSKQGIPAMVNYRPIHLTSYFSNTFGYKVGDFPVAERIGNETISLPLYPAMPDSHRDAVVQAMIDCLQALN